MSNREIFTDFSNTFDPNAVLNPKEINLGWIKDILNAYNSRKNVGLNLLFPAIRVPSNLTYLSDNGGDVADLAVSEITNRIDDIERLFQVMGFDNKFRVNYRDIPSQDWRAGAFDLAQLKNDSVCPDGRIIMLNCAPRLEQRGKLANNEGEPFYIGIDKRDMIVMATSAHSFAFLRDEIEAGTLNVFPVRMNTGGLQFRSRDIFPWACMALGMLSHYLPHRDLFDRLQFIDRAQKLTVDKIPNLSVQPEAARIDVHGNVKLSVRYNDVARIFEGNDDDLYVVVNDRALKCRLRKASFDSSEGNTGISNGSSGKWTDKGTKENGFAEIFTVGDRAADMLGLTSEIMKNGGVDKGRANVMVHFVRGYLLQQFADKVQAAYVGHCAKADATDTALPAGIQKHKSLEAYAVQLVHEGCVKGYDNSALRRSI